MKSAAPFSAVLVTAPDLKTARKLVTAALKAKLVACANLVPRIESHYWWQRKIERGNEVLIIFKAPKSKLKSLEQLVLKLHPYTTPEFLVLPLESGAKAYLYWLAESCG